MSELSKYPKVTSEIIKEHGLSNVEYEKITDFLQRDANYVELGIYSVMWSEHCSYKSSIKMLKTSGFKKAIIKIGNLIPPE